MSSENTLLDLGKTSTLLAMSDLASTVNRLLLQQIEYRLQQYLRVALLIQPNLSNLPNPGSAMFEQVGFHMESTEKDRPSFGGGEWVPHGHTDHRHKRCIDWMMIGDYILHPGSTRREAEEAFTLLRACVDLRMRSLLQLSGQRTPTVYASFSFNVGGVPVPPLTPDQEQLLQMLAAPMTARQLIFHEEAMRPFSDEPLGASFNVNTHYGYMLTKKQPQMAQTLQQQNQLLNAVGPSLVPLGKLSSP